MGHDSGKPPAAIAEKIKKVGTDLAESIRTVIDAVPGRPNRPNQLARELGLNRAISSKVLSAAAKKDPFEVAHLMPGPEPLRSLLRAAAARDVDRALIARAEHAVTRFEELISREAGTRGALDAIISSSLPGARDKLELASKYRIFKGMAQLMGVQAEAWVTSMLIHPTNNDPLHHDVAPIHGALGLRRLRPGVPVSFAFGRPRSNGGGEDAAIGSMPLEQFYTRPAATLIADQEGETLIHRLAGDALGPHAAVDMLAADHHRGGMARHAPPGKRGKRGTAVVPDVPVKTLVYDMLLHEDAFPGAEPALLIYDIGLRGGADVNDPARDVDRRDVLESIEFLGRDVRRFHAPEIPRYVEMLEYVCAELNWDPAAFRGYRCRVQYPIRGWQVCMAFDAPPAPDAEGA
jgi:hypothetical protein